MSTSLAPSNDVRPFSSLIEKVRLYHIPQVLRAMALEAFAQGDAVGLLCLGNNMAGLNIVSDNWQPLRARGIYEEALLRAIVSPRLNNRHIPLDQLHWLLSLANRERMIAAGDYLPGSGPFTLFRSVAGKTSARRIRGISWTDSLETAQWFTDRNIRFGLHDPAIYTVTVSEDYVYAFTSERQEREFILWLPDNAKVKRVKLNGPSVG